MEISFRSAQEKNSKKLFDWRNDPVTRENSIHSAEIPWEDHQKWFAGSLKNPNRQIWMAIADNNEIGMIRVDKGDSGAELSWSVAPEYRGKGYGGKILTAFVQAYPGEYFARVKKQNLASLKMAETVGFKPISQDGEIVILSF